MYNCVHLCCIQNIEPYAVIDAKGDAINTSFGRTESRVGFVVCVNKGRKEEREEIVSTKYQCRWPLILHQCLLINIQSLQLH